MTSLVTTLTLMMVFNAVVFDGVSAQQDDPMLPPGTSFTRPPMPKDTDVEKLMPKCQQIAFNVTQCIDRKWTQLADIEQKSRDCCKPAELLCGVNRVYRSDDCKSSIDVTVEANMKKAVICSGVTNDVQKHCSALKRVPIEDKCKVYEKYMNCFANASSHLMSRQLLVFTPIVTLFVIYFFN